MRIFVIGLCILMTITGCNTNQINTEKWQAELRQLRTEWEREHAA